MFSHANPNKVTQNPRNLTDEQIKAVGENGGMIGVCTWGPLCSKNDPTKRPTVDDVIDHIDHVVDLMGIDHVGIGTDSACTTNTAWLSQHSLEFNSAYPEIANEFISHHGRSSGMPEINTLDRMTDGLLNRGYTDGDVLKVIGGNFLRHFRTVWRA
jgi:membrane dipeptidase